MAAGTTSIHPISTLRLQLTALDAAMSQCLADPSEKPVHRVRTAIRRVEAQLELIALLPDLPDHASAASKLHRGLRKLRREAGRVRDLDVLRDKLNKTGAEPGLWTGGLDEPSHRQAAVADKLRRESHKLDRRLKRQRETEAKVFVGLLRKRQANLARAVGKLLAPLQPAETFVIPPQRLMDLALELFHDRTPQHTDNLSDEQMHGIRKCAKLARYLLEAGPANDHTLHKLAGRYKELQESGGHWHDLVTLAEKSRKQLGRKSGLAERAAQLRDRTLAHFRREVEAGIQPQPSTPQRFGPLAAAPSASSSEAA